MSESELVILHEDERLVAVDKPAWWVVHSTRGCRDAPTVIGELQRRLGQRVFPVHRLDRQASGVLLMARDAETASTLCQQIRDGLWDKRYTALCRGVIRDSIRIDHPVPEGEARREALTLVDPIEVYGERFSLISAEPRSGRRHQIRYHLKHMSHPLVGDTNYGKGPINRFFRAHIGLSRLFLHASRLRLPHPTQNLRLELNAALPLELRDALCRLAEASES